MRNTHFGVSEMLQRIFQKINILGRQKIYPYSLVRSLLLHSSIETTAGILLELHQLGNEFFVCLFEILKKKSSLILIIKKRKRKYFTIKM